MRRRLTSAFAIAATCALSAWPAAADPNPGLDRADPGTVEILALNVYHEAKGEGRRGMLAVGWVVLNRAADPAFPGGVEAVVQQGCQFSWLCDDRPDAPSDRRAWVLAREVAEELLTDPPPDPTGGAMWYHAERVNPGWGERLAVSTRIGNHVFYAKAGRQPRPKPKPEAVLAQG